MKKQHTVTVGRGPVPRHRSCARPCSSGSPDPEPFVIRRAQTTDGGTHVMTMELAGDRPPRYGEKNGTLSFAIIRVIHRSRGTGPRATGTSRPGGLSYGEQLRPGGLSYPRKTYHPANLGNLGNPALNLATPDRWGNDSRPERAHRCSNSFSDEHFPRRRKGARVKSVKVNTTTHRFPLLIAAIPIDCLRWRRIVPRWQYSRR